MNKTRKNQKVKTESFVDERNDNNLWNQEVDKSQVVADYFHFSNKESDRLWQDVRSLLPRLTKTQIQQMAITIKPKLEVTVSCTVLAALIHGEIIQWVGIQKLLQKPDLFLKQIKSIKNQMMEGVINEDIVKQCAQKIKKLPSNFSIISEVATKIVSYCNQCLQEQKERVNVYGQPQSTGNNSMVEELKQIEDDIRQKKETIKQFLEYSYQQNQQKTVDLLVQQDTPKENKAKINNNRDVAKTQQKHGNQLHSLSSTPKPLKSSIPSKSTEVRFNADQVDKIKYQCKLNLSSNLINDAGASENQTTKNQQASLTPKIIQQTQPTKQEYNSKKKKQSLHIVQPQVCQENLLSESTFLEQTNLRKEIQLQQKEIIRLRGQEQELKWKAVRQAKQDIIEQERKKQLEDLEWARQEQRRKQEIENQSQHNFKKFVLENSTFKHILTSPRSDLKPSLPTHKPKVLTQHEESILEDLEKNYDQYRSLKSQLNASMREKSEVLKNVDVTKQLLTSQPQTKRWK